LIMSYAIFLLLFLGLPLCALLRVVRLPRAAHIAIGATGVLALLYTAPWDNALILNGVWSYGRGHVLGATIGVVPLEEYLFYILQVLLAGTITAWLLPRLSAGRG